MISRINGFRDVVLFSHSKNKDVRKLAETCLAQLGDLPKDVPSLQEFCVRSIAETGHSHVRSQVGLLSEDILATYPALIYQPADLALKRN